jgi:hypothetical protein
VPHALRNNTYGRRSIGSSRIHSLDLSRLVQAMEMSVDSMSGHVVRRLYQEHRFRMT